MSNCCGAAIASRVRFRLPHRRRRRRLQCHCKKGWSWSALFVHKHALVVTPTSLARPETHYETTNMYARISTAMKSCANLVCAIYPPLPAGTPSSGSRKRSATSQTTALLQFPSQTGAAKHFQGTVPQYLSHEPGYLNNSIANIGRREFSSNNSTHSILPVDMSMKLDFPSSKGFSNIQPALGQRNGATRTRTVDASCPQKGTSANG